MRKIFYLLYIVVSALILFQSSRFIDTVIEKKITIVPEEDAGLQALRSSPPPREEDTYDISMFNSTLFSVPEKTESQSGNQTPEAAESPLVNKYILDGIIVLPAGRSIAIIRRVRERQGSVYRKGDMIDNYEIVKIEKFRVLMSDGLTTSALSMYARPQNRERKVIARSTRPAPRMTGYENAKKIKKVLSRSDVENKVFSKVNQILTQIAISPYMVNGTMEGLRLIRVPNNSIVYELGGRSGDIIRRVNGHEVNQIDQMYKLWDNIKDDSFISVDLERNKQIFTYNFEIRE
jgi:type II secretion system protein C